MLHIRKPERFTEASILLQVTYLVWSQVTYLVWSQVF